MWPHIQLGLCNAVGTILNTSATFESSGSPPDLIIVHNDDPESVEMNTHF